MATITEERETFERGLFAKRQAFLEGKLKSGCDGTHVLPQRDYRDRTCYCSGERSCSNRAWSSEKMNGAVPYCTKRTHSR